jgi:transposase-like protein
MTQESATNYAQTAGGTFPGQPITHTGTCDICRSTDNPVIYDASVHGRWGWLCHLCFTTFGGQLGVGLGQQYTKQED